MRQFYLAEITTKDKLVHQGLFFKPSHKGEKAILWVHGLTSNFYGNIALLESFAAVCEKMGFGFASFNNRGHDMITGIKKVDRRKSKGYTSTTGGSGYEEFIQCDYDIDAGIEFLVHQGYSNVVIAGHSTGANKVCYVAGRRNDSRVIGVVLVSPISDRLVPQKPPSSRSEELLAMNRLIDKGKGDILLLNKHFFPISARRYISLFSPNSQEDTFDYGNPQPMMKYFSNIKKPLLVIFGENDESRDRPMKRIQKVFDVRTKSIRYSSNLIKDGFHTFYGKEEELVSRILHWSASL